LAIKTQETQDQWKERSNLCVCYRRCHSPVMDFKLR